MATSSYGSRWQQLFGLPQQPTSQPTQPASQLMNARQTAGHSASELALFRQLIDNSDDLFCVLDNHLVYRAANRAYLRAWRITRKALIGRHVKDILSQDFYDNTVKPRLEQCLRGEKVVFEAPRRNTAGQLRRQEICYTPWFGDQGRVRGVLVQVRDIHDRYLFQQRLQRKERLLDEAQQVAELGNWEQDFQQQTLWWSPQLYRILELDPETPPAFAHLIDRVHADDRDRVLAQHAKSVFQRPDWRLRYRLSMPDDRLKHVLEHCHTEFAENAALHRRVGTLQDITERELALQAQTQFFELAMDLLCIIGPDNTLLRVNPAWETILGYSEAELLNQNGLELVHPDDISATRRALQQVLCGQVLEHFENRCRHKNGDYRDIAWSARMFRSNGLVYAVGHDVTERKRMEREIRYRADLEQCLAEISTKLLCADKEALKPLIDWALARIGARIGAARACVALFQPGQRAARLTHEWHDAALEPLRQRLPVLDTQPLPLLMQHMRAGRISHLSSAKPLANDAQGERDLLAALGMQSLLLAPLRDDKHLFGIVCFASTQTERHWCEDELQVLRFLGNLIGGAIGRQRATDALSEARQQLEMIAYYDPLTGLANRRLLMDRLRQAMAVANREQHLLAVCYLDLDGFKPINDTHGHEAGDELLVAMAKRLTAGIRQCDTIARLGGDEFCALLGDMKSPTKIAEALDRIIERLAEPYTVNGQSVTVSASIGVAVYPQDASEADSLLRQADQSMYRAKQEGSNNYRFYSTDTTQP